MQIIENTVASFHYLLRDAEGNELESSKGGDPVAYLHGHGNIVVGLEKAMRGKESGDVFSATVKPSEGYGERIESATQRVPIKHLHGEKKKNAKFKPGQIISISTENGPKQVVVIKAGKFNVDVDTNHPLAGKTLIFDIEIETVREASPEEVAHGHAHGPGGHHH